MRDYVIITDSACDLPVNFVESLGIDVLPMRLMIDNTEYRHYHDYRELSMKSFYKKIRDGHIGQTSCVSTGTMVDAFEAYAKKGIDVLYISLSSGLSGSYSSSVIAAQTVKSCYADFNIEVIDSKSVSLGIGMLVYIAVQNKMKGFNLTENAKYLNEHACNICHCFMVDDLQYLQHSGRISAIGAIAGTAIGVKPIFKLDNSGHIAMSEKVRGSKMAMRKMFEMVSTKCHDTSIMFVAHMDNEDGAQTLANKIKDFYSDANIVISNIGPIIGNHTGFGTLAVIYYGDNR